MKSEFLKDLKLTAAHEAAFQMARKRRLSLAPHPTLAATLALLGARVAASFEARDGIILGFIAEYQTGTAAGRSAWSAILLETFRPALAALWSEVRCDMSSDDLASSMVALFLTTVEESALSGRRYVAANLVQSFRRQLFGFVNRTDEDQSQLEPRERLDFAEGDLELDHGTTLLAEQLVEDSARVRERMYTMFSDRLAANELEAISDTMLSDVHVADLVRAREPGLSRGRVWVRACRLRHRRDRALERMAELIRDEEKKIFCPLSSPALPLSSAGEQRAARW